ncbi:hypothetical protein EMIHUDRAFT_446805 [Emiliania huxleyi CCMP1516]|uniref:Uncharacterized protein n=2 Tax=Emiliania huxleyi TaxID=2903 RepID=A0A0D3KWU1_EMIH1|nr:hypothetical protein EMIHUDRAFT_446805 [Emiliania huxleyi CCMP1516]EOD40226.1 hypothetical protein EMIHUDRAFT_446805 [Emiliania huxleyi CCMP1516]|eukprot:XP_005792655.1 hypothetical protein EMIHUDRAFT_446805 [Emiliania huxleyi CCMP1516]
MLAVLAAASSSLQDTVGGPECSPCRLPYIGEPPVGKRRAAILIEGPCDFCGADGRCCSQDAAGSPGCVGGVDVWQPCGVERFCCSSTPPRPYASGDDAGPLLPRPQVLLLLLAVGIAVLVVAAAAASRARTPLGLTRSVSAFRPYIPYSPRLVEGGLPTTAGRQAPYQPLNEEGERIDEGGVSPDRSPKSEPGR